MKRPNTLFVRLRAVIVLIYAVILILLIPLFFINYNGRWMQWIADKLPVQERTAIPPCEEENR